MPEQNMAPKKGPGRPSAAPQTVLKGGSRLRMRNWRLRTKVIAVIVVPTLTALALGGLRAAVDLDRAAEFRQTVSQVDLARNVTALVQELQKERTLAVAWVANDREGPRTELDTQIGLVNQEVDAAQEAASALETDDGAAKARYNIGLQRLSALGAIRSTTEASNFPDVAVFGAYSQVLDAVVRLGREINTAVSDRGLLRDSDVIQALSEAKENVAKENAILQIAAAQREFPADMLFQIRDAQASAAGALADYRANASTEQLQLFSDTVSGREVDDRERIKAQAISTAERSTRQDPQPLDISEADLTNTGAATLERMRTVEGELLENLRDNADALADEATASAWRDAAFVLAALLLALGLMAIVTRSLLKPLRVLRREAYDIADRKLPASVQRILADPDPAEAAKHAVEPVPVFTREETGQLARSFDAVQEQAVLMATEQALLRDNINSIFVNLSRRSQALVERQLSLIDRLEQDEQDPDQLASLFELDHLATRMRRNSESLLVLSGTGLSRQLNRPVPASEVVGAAVSEVEHYARIEVASAPEVAVQGRAVSDLVHVIAELLDNATFFSEPEKKVIVRMAMTRKKELAIQITDQGVGMSEDEINAANARLADPPDLDVAVTRRMGLYVVARLAKRHNIVVRLRDNEDIEGGLIARINVPADLVQPIGAAPRSMSATSTTSSLQAAAMDAPTGVGLGSSMPNVPNTPAPVRNSGIAGAFTGNMPRLRPDGGTVGEETRQERTPQEVAGYPAFPVGGNQQHDQNAGSPANGAPTEAGPPNGSNGRNDGRNDGDHTATLFGNPLPDPGPADQEDPGTGGYPPLGAGRPAQEVDHSVDAPTERLPIYEAVLSQWFESADTGSHQRQPADPQPPQPAASNAATNAATNGATNGSNGAVANGNGAAAAAQPPAQAPRAEPQPESPAETTGWTSPGDDGWLAAQALLETTPETTTTAGLPKRVPKAHLVPGSAAPRQEETTAETPAAPPLPPRTADAVRGRMSSFQQGVRRGRHALIEAYAGDQSGPEVSRKDEEQE